MRMPTPSWADQVAAYAEAAQAVTALVAAIDDPAAPGLGEWTVVELAGHTLRALTTVERYLEAAPVDGPDLADAAAYVTRYLGAHDDDPSGTDAAVAGRGREEAAALGDDTAAVFVAAVARVVARLDTVDPETVIPTAWESIRIDDYLRTRVMELVLHGLDLAAALDVDWDPPAAALADTLLLLTEVAVRRGHGTDLARLLAGRPATAAVLPVIR